MRTLLLAVLVLCLSRCAGEMACTELAVAGLRLKVNDENGGPVCDATVTARDGSYLTPLEPLDCAYLGAWERPGTYVVEITKKDFKPASLTDVSVVAADTCHVRTAEIVATLTPE